MTPRSDAPVGTRLINFVPSSCQAIFLHLFCRWFRG